MLRSIDLANVIGGAPDAERCEELRLFVRASRSVPGMGPLAVGKDAEAEAKHLGCAWVKS